METLSRNHTDARITLIDATELDEEQFNDLISNIDARRSLVPILCILAVFLSLAMII